MTDSQPIAAHAIRDKERKKKKEKVLLGWLVGCFLMEYQYMLRVLFKILYTQIQTRTYIYMYIVMT